MLLLALAGVAAEFDVVMQLCIDQAIAGALLRIRPKMMTVAVIIAGLLPILFSDGTGSDLMKRIAAPLVGGMLTAPLLSLFVMPATYLIGVTRRGCRA